MARRPRLYMPRVAQHVIQRSIGEQLCFGGNADYRAYLSILEQSSSRFGVAIHAFVLMPNHVHILATPSDEYSMGKMLQAVGRRYVQYFNREYQRSGGLWDGRYKSTVVQTKKYLLNVYRYIELNPVRAGIAEHAAKYPWSSYRHNAVGLTAGMITPHKKYRKLGSDDASRQMAYRLLFRSDLPKGIVERIRDCTNKSWVLGDKRFKVKFEAKTGVRASRAQRGGDRRSAAFRNALPNVG